MQFIVILFHANVFKPIPSHYSYYELRTFFVMILCNFMVELSRRFLKHAGNLGHTNSA